VARRRAGRRRPVGAGPVDRQPVGQHERRAVRLALRAERARAGRLCEISGGTRAGGELTAPRGVTSRRCRIGGAGRSARRRHRGSTCAPRWSAAAATTARSPAGRRCRAGPATAVRCPRR
jgi:hypothetical protein